MGKTEEVGKGKDNFRDSLSTVDKDGKRVWIYPQKPVGKLYKYRKLLSYVLLAFLLGAPFIKINGNPLLLFNVLERKFVILGLPFWPPDFYLVVFGLITAIIFITLFTVVYGRIFCGWFCPQTIFMEMLFRRIEYLIEGDYTKQKKLDKQDWDTEKVFKKTLKHVVFFGISFFIANVFLAYIISVDQLWVIITDPPSEHVSGLIAILIFSGVFYFIFAKFREQVCTIACPYGRLQGVLLDKKSIVVAYDHERGEPRGKLRKGQARTEGDCIDCYQCVQVCPTGIDIRNGTQLECINCTACIDACNNIMDKIDKPRGLIRYDSEDGILKGEKFRFTPRVIAYSVLLTVLVGALTSFLFIRADIDVNIYKTRGVTFLKMDDGTIRNMYELTVINKTIEEYDLEVKLVSVEGNVVVTGGEMILEKQGIIQRRIFIDIPKEKVTDMSMKVKIGVFSGGKLLKSKETNFIGPLKF